MDANRKAAYTTLFDMQTKGSYSNIELNRQIEKLNPSSPAFVRELVYGVTENRLLLDYIIDHLATRGVKSIKAAEVTILRMGIYQIRCMNSVPEYAAVNESVNIAKKFAKRGASFINGMLRSYLRDGDKIKLPDREKDPVKYLSIKYSFNPWIIELWEKAYGLEFTEKLLAKSNETPKMTLRVNTLKTNREELLAGLEKTDKGAPHALDEADIECTSVIAQPGTLAKTAINLTGSGILATSEYKEGKFSVQDEASQFAIEVLDPQPADTIIDVCAAPGGKTFAMAEKMGNTGKIYSRDIYKNKIEAITKETNRLGIKNVEVTLWDATKFDETLIKKGDKVLVDAPCSGLGVIRRKPEIKFKNFEEGILDLPKKQLEILEVSARYVKPRGVLMYCTCTINSCENEEIVRAFLENHKEFTSVYEKQLLPNLDDTDGFYICKMEKA